MTSVEENSMDLIGLIMFVLIALLLLAAIILPKLERAQKEQEE